MSGKRRVLVAGPGRLAMAKAAALLLAGAVAASEKEARSDGDPADPSNPKRNDDAR